MKKVRLFGTKKDMQALNVGLGHSSIKAQRDQQIIPLPNFKRNQDFFQDLWAKFATDTFDGIDCLFTLKKNDAIVTVPIVEFSIYLISPDQNWNETLLHTKYGFLNANGSHSCRFSQTEIGNTISLDGENTFAIKISTNRLRKKFKKTIYVNHLGVYDSIVRLRNKVNYLEISKMDE